MYHDAPLSETEIQQQIRRSWKEGREKHMEEDLGIFGLPQHQTWSKADWEEKGPSLYRTEWERAYQYGLADSALENVLKRLGAPADPKTPLVHAYSLEDLAPLWNAIEAMCDVDEVYAWGITISASQGARVKENMAWAYFVLGAFLLFLLGKLSDADAWYGASLFCSLGGALAYVLGERQRQKNRAALPSGKRLNPRVTFLDLAENVVMTAQGRAEEMQEAAVRVKQNAETL